MKYFDNKKLAIGYIIPELVATLHDDVRDQQRNNEPSEAYQDLLLKVEDVEEVQPLVEAAPELLEALKGMMIWAKTTAMYHLRDEESLPRGFEKWEQLIAKAEGES